MNDGKFQRNGGMPDVPADEAPPVPPVSTGKMHQNVPVWSDPCCSCEAEPYWREVAEEMGIDLDGEGGDT